MDRPIGPGYKSFGIDEQESDGDSGVNRLRRNNIGKALVAKILFRKDGLADSAKKEKTY